MKNKIKRSFIPSPFLVKILKLSATSPNSKTRNKWIYANFLLRRARPKPIKPRLTAMKLSVAGSGVIVFAPEWALFAVRPMEFAHLPVRSTLLAAKATKRLI
jgi:hypothetical protein